MILGRGSLREHWTQIRGFRMFARVGKRNGRRKTHPVVLVHGLGVSSRYMTPLASNLARCFPVYVPDLPGFGRSEKPRRSLELRTLAEILRAWLEEVGIRSPIVVGNSMGCQIMVELACLDPRSAAAAVLLGPTMDATAPHWASHILRLFEDQFREPPSLVPLQAFDYLTNGPLRTVATFRKALRHDMLGRIHHLTMPTLVLRGERDEIVSREWALQLVQRLPNGSLLEIPEAGHALNYNSPERVGEHVRRLAASLHTGT